MINVVILHDWLTGFRGGERVLEVFCELFPNAPIYTLIYKEGSVGEIIGSRKITSSFLNKVPGIESSYRKFLPFFPKAAEGLKILEEADLVLSSSHCVIKGVKKPKGSTHISYIHSPMRYLYDQYEVYFGKSAPFYQRWGARVFKKYLIKWDKSSNENVDHMIANSSFVKDRIRKYYNKDSFIIHPFVDLNDFKNLKRSPPQKEDFYLIVSAFAPNKRVDLAIKVFNSLGKNLVIIGSGQQEESLKKMSNSNIIFKGNLSREEVVEHFFKAKALIFPGTEDFGITPLEALASRTPVIAYKIGGVLETLTEKVAVFFEEQSEESILNAINQFEDMSFKDEDLYSRAEDFSKEIFKENMINFIEKSMQIKISS